MNYYMFSVFFDLICSESNFSSINVPKKAINFLLTGNITLYFIDFFIHVLLILVGSIFPQSLFMDFATYKLCDPPYISANLKSIAGSHIDSQRT